MTDKQDKKIYNELSFFTLRIRIQDHYINNKPTQNYISEIFYPI